MRARIIRGGRERKRMRVYKIVFCYARLWTVVIRACLAGLGEPFANTRANRRGRDRERSESPDDGLRCLPRRQDVTTTAADIDGEFAIDVF